MRLVTLDVRDLSPRLVGQLVHLTLDAGRMRSVVTDPDTDAAAILALDPRGLLGWATVERDGLVGVFVARGCRRQGIGAELAEAAHYLLAVRWPGVPVRSSARPRSPGASFWREMANRWAITSTVQRMRRADGVP